MFQEKVIQIAPTSGLIHSTPMKITDRYGWPDDTLIAQDSLSWCNLHLLYRNSAISYSVRVYILLNVWPFPGMFKAFHSIYNRSRTNHSACSAWSRVMFQWSAVNQPHPLLASRGDSVMFGIRWDYGVKVRGNGLLKVGGAGSSSVTGGTPCICIN